MKVLETQCLTVDVYFRPTSGGRFLWRLVTAAKCAASCLMVCGMPTTGLHGQLAGRQKRTTEWHYASNVTRGFIP